MKLRAEGHIFTVSPKGLSGLAGVGIEYSWGEAKLEFHGQTKKDNPKGVREFRKKHRVDVFMLMEKKVKMAKTHRNIVDMEVPFTTSR